MFMEEEGLIRHTRSMLILTRKDIFNSSNSSKDMVVVGADMEGLTTRLPFLFITYNQTHT